MSDESLKLYVKPIHDLFDLSEVNLYMEDLLKDNTNKIVIYGSYVLALVQKHILNRKPSYYDDIDIFTNDEVTLHRMLDHFESKGYSFTFHNIPYFGNVVCSVVDVRDTPIQIIYYDYRDIRQLMMESDLDYCQTLIQDGKLYYTKQAKLAIETMTVRRYSILNYYRIKKAYQKGFKLNNSLIYSLLDDMETYLENQRRLEQHDKKTYDADQVKQSIVKLSFPERDGSWYNFDDIYVCGLHTINEMKSIDRDPQYKRVYSHNWFDQTVIGKYSTGLILKVQGNKRLICKSTHNFNIVKVWIENDEVKIIDRYFNKIHFDRINYTILKSEPRTSYCDAHVEVLVHNDDKKTLTLTLIEKTHRSMKSIPFKPDDLDNIIIM